MPRVAALLACALSAAGALAHPHGEIRCGADVQLQDGSVRAVEGELVLDRAHSQQVLAELQPQAGTFDPVLLQRFALSMKIQFGRFGWLLDLQGDGRSVPLGLAGEPEIDAPGGMVRIRVRLQPLAQDVRAEHWSLQCRDPTYYWVTTLQAPAFSPARSPAPPP